MSEQSTLTALDLVEQAAALLGREDMRRVLLESVAAVWERPASRSWTSSSAADDARWSVAALVLDYDDEGSVPMVREVVGCSAQIVDQFEYLASSLGQTPEEDWPAKARELRAAVDRLAHIGRTVADVYLLDAEVRS